MAPKGKENPVVVLMSPGPGHETWFEHSYLATYLGISLVRGQDLELRGDHIWEKSVAGDRMVDVILRRVNDAWCDPLYLRSDSLLGVPGLVRAVQAGTVAVVNPLGSGVLHNPALQSRMDAICQYLLGEPLILPSLKTYWLGDVESIPWCLENLSQMVIKRVFPEAGQESIFGRELDRAGLERWKSILQAEPQNWVCQEESIHSTVPSFVDGRMESRHVVLRTFACGNPQSGYRVMPGGLSRIGRDATTLMVSNQYGGISKDTWILSTEPEKEILNREAVQSVGSQSHISLPAAAAENLFWMGRYLERSIVLIRRLREVMDLDMHEDIPSPLCAALTCVTGGLWINEGCNRSQLMNGQVVYDVERPGSLAFNLRWLAWNGRSLRGIIGSESLALVQRFSEISQEESTLDLERHLDHISTLLRALDSTFMDWNVDDPRYVFVQLGQKCEWLQIAQSTLSLVRFSDGGGTARLVMEVDRGAPPGLVSAGRDLLRHAMQESRRPRSLVSTAEMILSLLRRLPHARDRLREKPEALTLRLLSSLALGELEAVSSQLASLTDALQEKYLSAQTPQMVSGHA